jgi:hypothetical protein
MLAYPEKCPFNELKRHRRTVQIDATDHPRYRPADETTLDEGSELSVTEEIRLISLPEGAYSRDAIGVRSLLI